MLQIASIEDAADEIVDGSCAPETISKPHDTGCSHTLSLNYSNRCT